MIQVVFLCTFEFSLKTPSLYKNGHFRHFSKSSWLFHDYLAIRPVAWEGSRSIVDDYSMTITRVSINSAITNSSLVV